MLKSGNLVQAILVSGICLFFVGNSFGQPEIVAVDGSAHGEFSHGQSVLIEGAEFGFKSPASPLRYENFEDGTIGDRIKGQGEGGFHTDSHLYNEQPKYSQGKQRTENDICAFQSFENGNYNQTIGLMFVDVDTLYMSGWAYRDDFRGTAANSTNQKLWGNVGKRAPETYYGNPQSRWDSYWGANNALHGYGSDCNGNSIQQNWTSSPKWFNQWIRQERYLAIGDPNGDNGISQIMVNNNLVAEMNGTFRTCPDSYDYWILGHYFRTDDSAELRIYWSEIYLDNTLARVEIGNDQSFQACTHREIQIPSAWSGDSVTFSANTGTFSSGEDLYLFVVDSYNQASPGFPITLLSSPGGTVGTPDPPTWD